MRQTIDSVRKTRREVLVNFDLIRAFERVDCRNVLETLMNWNLNHRIPDAVCKIANRRTFKVETRQFPRISRSEPTTTRRGAPQGSSNGHVLFVIEVDSLLQLLSTLNIKATMYSDGLAMIPNWIELEDQISLQARIQLALDTVVNWCMVRHFFINKTKCSHAVLGNLTAPPFNIRIDSAPRMRDDRPKYLRIRIGGTTKSRNKWIESPIR